MWNVQDTSAFICPWYSKQKIKNLIDFYNKLLLYNI